MDLSFAAVLKRVISRQNTKTTTTVVMNEVTLEEQLRILARVKERNNSTPVTANNPRRLMRDFNETYGV